MKKEVNKVINFGFWTALTIFAVSVLLVSAASATTVSIGSNSTAKGDTAVVPLMISDVANLGGVGINLTFDESVVNVTALENSDFDSPPNLNTRGPGWIVLEGGQYESGLSDNVKLCDVTLEAVGEPEESSYLNLTGIVLEDMAMNPITVDAVINGTFTVTGAAAPYLVTYTISKQTIIPPETTSIDVEFSEEVNWVIAIENATTGVVVRDWDGTSTNPTPKIWDGTYEVNGVVPDGDYRVNVTGVNTTNPELRVVNNTEIIRVASVLQVLTTITVSPPTAPLPVDGTQPFTATAKDQNDNPMAGIIIAWTSSDESVGTVSPASATTGSDGTATTTFTALAVGTTTVKAENVTTTVNGTASVEVYEPEVTEITVSPSEKTLHIDDTQQFTATVKDQNDNPMAGIDITWTSSNTTVGTVSPASATTGSDGNATTTFTASALGTSTVTAENVTTTVNGTASVNVSEEPSVLTTIEVAPATAEVYVGDTKQFTATAKDQYGDPMAGIIIAWTSSKPSVGTVSPASATTTFTALAVGTTTVKAENVSTDKSDTASVEVKRRYVGGGGRGAPRDTDGDGYTDIQEMLAGTDKDDPCDPNPECAACLALKPAATPTPTPTPTATPTAKPTTPPVPTPEPTAEPEPTATPEPPGFEAVFAIAGLLAVAYLVVRRKRE
ncbi:MAG TPA: hypothetical protein C5S37_04400 [Methanophagales archaeon]|nr:hypothetical protein [Methanophagales archaeon]